MHWKRRAMPDLDLTGLRKHLLRSGIAPRHVRRTVAELSDHYDDLLQSELQAGADPDAAHGKALDALGDMRDVAAAIRSRPELRAWSHRMPYLALVVYPLTCLALLPVVPVMAGVAHVRDLARWLTCIFLGGVITAALFLIMQLSIVLT